MAFNNKTSSKPRTPSTGGPRPVARKLVKESVFRRCRNLNWGLTKTQFRQHIACFRNGLRDGLRYLEGNGVEVNFRRSQAEAARLAGLL